MNYKFNFDHEKKDFVEAIGVGRDKHKFLEYQVKDILEGINKEDKQLSKSQVIERIIMSIPGKVSPIELFFLGCIASRALGFISEHGATPEQRLEELEGLVDKFKKEGMNVDEAIEKVLSKVIDISKLTRFILEVEENDF